MSKFSKFIKKTVGVKTYKISKPIVKAAVTETVVQAIFSVIPATPIVAAVSGTFKALQ